MNGVIIEQLTTLVTILKQNPVAPGRDPFLPRRVIRIGTLVKLIRRQETYFSLLKFCNYAIVTQTVLKHFGKLLMVATFMLSGGIPHAY